MGAVQGPEMTWTPQKNEVQHKAKNFFLGIL